MTSVLDNAVLIGKETTYGTPATLTRGYEALGDGWKRQHEYLASVGMRPGKKATLSTRRRVINMGAEGTLELDFLTSGMGLLMEALFGETTGPTQIDSSDAYEQVHEVGSDESPVSLTVQVIRSLVGGSTQAFTYHGAVATGWTISQEVGGLAKVEVNFDAEDEDLNTAAGTPVYPSDAVPYDWTQCEVTVNGTPVDFTNVSVEADLSLKTDRRFLRGSHLKRRPVRNGVPTYTGTLEGEFSSVDVYEDFVNGVVQPLKIEWTGAAIDGSNNYKVTLDLPAVQYEGETPEASPEETTTHSVPFAALDDGSNAPVKLTIVSEDTAL